METTFDLAQLGKKKSLKVSKPEPKWQKPRHGVLKVNVDASFIAQNAEDSTGLVVRDYEGHLILGQALWYRDAASAMVMEANAIRDGVQLALDRNYMVKGHGCRLEGG
jgi:hypothetical protein